MLDKINFSKEEYLSIDNLHDLLLEEASCVNEVDLSLDEIKAALLEQKSDLDFRKKNLLDSILVELPYYWSLLDDSLKEKIQVADLLKILYDLPILKANALTTYLRNKLSLFFEINEDLLQSCIYYYSRFKKEKQLLSSQKIIEVYKAVYAKHKNFTLKDIGFVISEYKK